MKVRVDKYDITKCVPEIICSIIYDLDIISQYKAYIDDITVICEHVGYQITLEEEN